MNTLSIIQVGDSLVFKHKQQENIYLFNNQRAFHQCNFAQANLLHHLTWHPPQPGNYYFSTRSCESGEKLSLRVLTLTPPQHSSAAPAFPPLAAPPPTSGGDLPSLPSNGWVPTSPIPNNGPSPSPTSEAGIPFINSNPAVPIPTGETDSTTIRPLPMSGDGTQVVGLGWKHPIQMEVVVVLTIMISFALGLCP
ncbi:hypothetical protein J5N97_021268 [Dioscorea zingiberensis]|uniref:Uncharacterized protein n=1 Tax=Dioscorea zingiberensis TaxID=325984 RepID=A0A9D5HE51_9LILI|nr:hypothetical protein J5N97_021268 [Dioscorea zingiberensis]